MSESNVFLLKFQNIPLMNLRADFQRFEEDVSLLIVNENNHQVSSSVEWINNQFEIDHDFNEIMRLCIMGIECYVSAAVWETMHRCGTYTPEVKEKINNPFSMGRKAHEVYYHHLPQLIGEPYSLKLFDNNLWSKTVALYREVRNKIFHGYQATDITPKSMQLFVNHIAEMYDWIDLWHSLEIRDSKPAHPAPRPEYMAEYNRRHS